MSQEAVQALLVTMWVFSSLPGIWAEEDEDRRTSWQHWVLCCTPSCLALHVPPPKLCPSAHQGCHSLQAPLLEKSWSSVALPLDMNGPCELIPSRLHCQTLLFKTHTA